MFPFPGAAGGTVTRETLELPESDEFNGATGTTGGVALIPVPLSSVVLPDLAGIVRPRCEKAGEGEAKRKRRPGRTEANRMRGVRLVFMAMGADIHQYLAVAPVGCDKEPVNSGL